MPLSNNFDKVPLSNNFDKVPLSNNFDNFDKIICITLIDNKERHENVIKYSKELNIPIELYKVQKHPKGGRYGCFNSHIEVIKMAYKNDYENILIFEDDFIPSPAYSIDVIKNVIEFMKNNNDYDIIKLGYVFAKTNLNFSNAFLSFAEFILSNEVAKNIIKCNGAMTHAYILSKKMIKLLAFYGEKELTKPVDQINQIDIWMCEIIDKYNLNSYFVLPLQIEQNYKIKSTNQSFNNLETFFRYLKDIFENILYLTSLLRVYRITIFFILVLLILILILCVNSFKK